jgi:hypothetical protein
MSHPEVHEIDEKTRKANVRVALIIGIVALMGIAAPFYAIQELAG